MCIDVSISTNNEQMRIQFRGLKTNSRRQKRKISREEGRGFLEFKKVQLGNQHCQCLFLLFGDISSNWRLMQERRRCNANWDPYLVLDNSEIKLDQSKAGLRGLPVCSDLERSRPGGGEALAMNWREYARLVDLLID